MQFISQKIQSLTQKTVDSTVDNLRDVFLRGGALVLLGTVVLWISVFIYVAFYYAYMPAVSHARPVHLQFQLVKFCY
jgi:seipin